MRELIPGYRKFKCDECGTEMQIVTRDHKSLSGVACPGCGEWLVPHHAIPDRTLPVDGSGNLKFDDSH